MRKYKILILIVIVLLHSGCATLYTGSKEKIGVFVTPEGADIYINNKKAGVAPNEIVLGRKYKKQHVTIKKEGYEDVEFDIKKEFNKIALFNIIGGWGFVVDLLTANILKYEKSYYDIEMKPIQNLSKNEVNH